MKGRKINNNDVIIHGKDYRGYKINNGRIHDFECYSKILDQVIEQAEYMLEKHSKVLNIRLDIRNPKDSEKVIQRKDITRVLENTKRNLNSHYKGCPNQLDLNYVWTTENEGRDKNPHFHLFISVNGNACQNGYGVMRAVENAVRKKLGEDCHGLVEFSKSNGKYGLRVNRVSENVQAEMEKSIYAASYLAKVNTKEGRPKGARISSASKLDRSALFTAAVKKEISDPNKIVSEKEQSISNLSCLP